MHAKSKSLTTTERPAGRRLPRQRPPTHPGEMLAEEFVKPLGITRKELARRLDVSYSSLIDIAQGATLNNSIHRPSAISGARYVSGLLVGAPAGLGSLARHEQP